MITFKEVFITTITHAPKQASYHFNYKNFRNTLNHPLLSNHYHHNLYDGKQKNALQGYVSTSKILNTYLWNKKSTEAHKFNLNIKPISDSLPFKKHLSEKFKQIRHIDKAIKKVQTPHDMTVWSGTVHDPRLAKDNNEIVHHPAYLSTSTKSGMAFNFAAKNLSKNRHVLKIHVPKGSHGVYIPGVLPMEENEREFLLPRGSKLKYIKTKKINAEEDYEGSGIHGTYHIHHMALIND